MALVSESKHREVFEKAIAYQFSDVALLELALTHPSYPFEHGKKPEHNQRLEFLGDAVLELAITEWLYKQYPDLDEGDLTKKRSSMVSKEALYHFANHLSMGCCLLLGPAEEKSGGRERESNLADAFEAVLGAIYLDADFTIAKRVVMRVFDAFPLKASAVGAINNPKGRLQEVLQAIFPEPPEYKVTHSSGPEHLPIYKVIVEWRGLVLAEGEGSSKKKAEVAAARAALKDSLWEKEV